MKKGEKMPEEIKRKIGRANAISLKGKKQSDVSNEKRRESNLRLGLMPPAWPVWKRHSIESRIKMSEVAKTNGTGKWMKGRLKKHWKDKTTYSLEDKEEISGRKKPEQCEVCGSLGTICFDHCHATGKFRGWICKRCNFALGLVKDNRETLLALAKYLEPMK